jgi:hypothetical protein
MYNSPELSSHINTSASIKSQTLILAEWNMNFADNIDLVGNYRFRPRDETKFSNIPNSFDPYDTGGYYTNATDADVVIQGGYLDQTLSSQELIPTAFLSIKQKEKLLYSLDDCFARFRPRSGINKLRIGVNNNYTHSANMYMSQRPRYYASDKKDKFKYWTSYRTEGGIEYGIANDQQGSKFYISDAAPFVVYKEPVPANRVVVKMQTNIGSIDLGPFSTEDGAIDDPLYGELYQTTPVDWEIQYLDADNSWVNALSFLSSDRRRDGSPIIGSDGYVEIGYGLDIPEAFVESFSVVGEVSDFLSLVPSDRVGDAYLVRDNASDGGTYHVWTGTYYMSFASSYSWRLTDYENDSYKIITSKIVNADSFVSVSGLPEYREFKYINGLRVVAKTMNNLNSTFDLIELSPRLVADISDYTEALSIQKNASDLGISGLPVGQLLASTGSITIFDPDRAFDKNNKKSLISKYAANNLSISIFDAFFGVDGVDYYVPIKTLYADGFPQIEHANRKVTINLRDKFFYFESLQAPQVFLPDISLSYAISVLLDSIGFSNYVFKRLDSESDPVIPFFYVPPDKTVAEILNELAVSTQSAMYFDEDNNFIVCSRGYMLPGSGERLSDTVIYGSKDDSKNLESIIDVAQQGMEVFNDGNINFSVNYIQKSYGTIRQAYVMDKDKTWIYKPVLLWEVPSEDTTKAINESSSTQSGYVLGAMPLNTSVTDVIPYVSNGEVRNNIIDIGEAVYWLSRYSGYFYANGEIIRFDAVEYSVPQRVTSNNATSASNVWLTSTQDYKEYFSQLPFNGKIYPTGRIRIYAEPNFESNQGLVSLKNGEVAKHGRGQFGTEVTSHSAGIDNYWTGLSSISGTVSDPFSKRALDAAQATGLASFAINVSDTGSSGTTDILEVKSRASKSYRSSTIKNFLSNTYEMESTDSPALYSPDTLQASALVFNGPSLSSDQLSKNHVSYVYKSLAGRETSMTSFGTRMRIIGKIENSETTSQSPAGGMPYYTISGGSANQDASISGGSGGLGVLIEPTYGTGYYFELAALSDRNIENYDTGNIYNIAFYKSTKSGSGNKIQFQTHYLWNGLSSVLVDDGKFTGQGRILAEENTTVYDLAVEYEDFASYRRFYLYINGTQIATVDDKDPLPVYQNMSMFVRGSSRCMFEHVFALSNNYGENPSSKIDAPISTAFGTQSITSNEAFRKYSISGLVQSTYLSGISSSGTKYNIFYDEFGTIMREAAYFDIKYDKAYPALYARLSPTFNKLRGYVVSGFQGNPYGAEFLIFNATDTQLVLDETSGNYLRIQGVTFTQSGQTALSVDEFYQKHSDLRDTSFVNDPEIRSPLLVKEEYKNIKDSRMKYGRREFTLDANYLQTNEDARSMMSWVMSKVSKERLAVGVDIFPNPMIQLGDIVNIYYKDSDGTDRILPETIQFVVYSISYTKNSGDSSSMMLYLSEVG